MMAEGAAPSSSKLRLLPNEPLLRCPTKEFSDPAAEVEFLSCWGSCSPEASVQHPPRERAIDGHTPRRRDH